MPDRRQVLGGLAVALLPLAAQAAPAAGVVTAVRGAATLDRGRGGLELAVGDPLHPGDLVRTGEDALAELLLSAETQVNLGPQAELLVEGWRPEAGGRLVVAGPMVFDRPGSLPKLDLIVAAEFGEIAVRGTRFFAGPWEGGFAVFVQRGAAEVRAGGAAWLLGPGEGLDLSAGGSAPGVAAAWEVPRILAAFASVGLVP